MSDWVERSTARIDAMRNSMADFFTMKDRKAERADIAAIIREEYAKFRPKWTKDLPDAKGWWWCRGREDGVPLPAVPVAVDHIKTNDPIAWVFWRLPSGEDVWIRVDELAKDIENPEWLGPIEAE